MFVAVLAGGRRVADGALEPGRAPGVAGAPGVKVEPVAPGARGTPAGPVGAPGATAAGLEGAEPGATWALDTPAVIAATAPAAKKSLSIGVPPLVVTRVNLRLYVMGLLYNDETE